MANTSPFNPRSSADDVLRNQNLSGQVIIVTGAKSGIGYETGRALAAAGASAIATCRALPIRPSDRSRMWFPSSVT